MAVRGVTKAEDVNGLAAVIVLAFSRDPFVRWLLPNPSQYLTYLTRIARLHAQRTAEAGGAYALDDDRGAAFWYPPGVHPDGEALASILDEAGALERLASVWEHVAPHEPEQPHWYLRQVGVDPALQGSGGGSALMTAGLTVVDERGDPAYLEATSPSNQARYERYGFVILAEIQVGDAPPVWPMLRPPS